MCHPLRTWIRKLPGRKQGQSQQSHELIHVTGYEAWNENTVFQAIKRNDTMTKYLNTLSLFLMCSISLITPNAVSASTAQAPLWQKAVRIAATENNLIPGSIKVYSEELDGDEQVKHVEESHTKIWVDASGELQEETTTYRDGKRVNDASEEDEEEENLTEAPAFLKPENQHRVSVNTTGERKQIGNRTCLAHQFTFKDDEEGVKGLAWLDEESGALLEAEYSLNPLPTGLKRMDSVLRFAYQPDGAWYLTFVSIDMFGGLLFIKEGARFQVTLDQYFPYTEQQNISALENEQAPTQPTYRILSQVR